MNTWEDIYNYIQDPRVYILDGFSEKYHPGMTFTEIEEIPSWEDALYEQQMIALKKYYPDYFNQLSQYDKMYGSGKLGRDIGKGLKGAWEGVKKTVKSMGENPLNLFNLPSNVMTGAKDEVQKAYQKDKEEDIKEHAEKIKKELEPKIKAVQERQKKIYEEEQKLNEEINQAANQKLQTQSGINEDVIKLQEKKYKTLKIVTISTISVLALVNIIFLIKYSTKK
jgi:hypothetical protein